MDQLIVAYICAAGTFLLLRLMSKHARSRTASFLDAANTLLLAILILNVLLTLGSAALCSTCYGLNFYAVLVGTFLLAFSVQLLFFYKRFRINTALTFASILLLILYVNLDLIAIVITFAKENEASGWAAYYAPSVNGWTAGLLIVYFAVCWLWAGKEVKQKRAA
jgi:hypothetical protein